METCYHLRDADTRKTFARAISHDPAELYKAVADQPATEPQFVERLRLHMASLLGSPEKLLLVREGVRDMQTIFDAALEDCPELPLNDALDVVQDPTTILAVAEIALRESTQIERYALQSDRSNYFSIDAARKQLLIGAKLPDHELSRSGCPYAGKGTETAKEIRIDPLFKRFVPWAGTIAVLYYFDTIGSPKYQAPARLRYSTSV